MKTCVICGNEAKADFNIKMKRTPICESCANSITWQHMESLRQHMESLIREKNRKIQYDEFVKDLPK